MWYSHSVKGRELVRAISRTTKLIPNQLTKQKLKQMERPEIIQNLRRHAHPSWFHRLLDVPTQHLRKLLGQYEQLRG